MTLPTTIYSFPAYSPRFSSTDKPVKLKFHQYTRATLLSNRGRDHNCDGRRTVEMHKLDLSDWQARSEEHTSELQSRFDIVCRPLLEKKPEKCLHADGDDLETEQDLQ